MNRGCFAYYKEGLLAAFAAFKKNKANYFKYYLFMLAMLLGNFTIVTSPICNLARVKMAKFVKDEKEIKVLDSFQSANRPKTWYTTLLSNSISNILILSILILVILCLVPLLLLSLSFSNRIITGIFFGLFAYAAIIIFEILTLVATLYFSPTNYIINMEPEISVTDVLHSSIVTMKRTGKLTLFGISFINSFLIGIFAFFLGIFIGVAFIGLSSGNQALWVVLMIFASFVLIGLVLALPVLILASQVAQISLFDDIIRISIKSSQDEEASVSSKGAQTSQEKPIDEEKEMSTDELLASLFDESV